MAKKKRKPQVGDVFQVALPNGRYAYGRVFKDATVGIYSQITDAPNAAPIGSRDFLFHVGIYDDVLRSGEWPVIGHDPFGSGESAWPPARYIKDPISGEYSIYFKGEIRPAAAEDCASMEQAAVWDASHIVDRVMNFERNAVS